MSNKSGLNMPHLKHVMPSRQTQPRRVRWADEQRSQKPVVLAVLVFSGFLLLLGAVSGWEFWTKTGASTGASTVARLKHDIQEVLLFPTESHPSSHPGHSWIDLRRRQSESPLASANSTPPLRTLQIDVPILGQGGKVIGAGTQDGFTGLSATTAGNDNSADSKPCEVTLGVNVFNNSFGSPLVMEYTPPACAAASNTVVMNLTVTSKGTQFDRLAFVYLGDIEIFRTSTEEPRLQGISWTYMKDMSHYMSLWKQPQKLIFDLPNAVDLNAKPNPLSGTYNTTLTASFFSASGALAPASTIIPISARQSQNNSQPSVFSVPSQSASNVITDFPRNAARAIFSVSATGQADEEFWWTNVLQSNTQTYNTTVGGFSPFREVQVFIDGQLAGVQWPFPVIFTGGVSPTFWTPIVGIDAFDLKETEIDISPWLGVLCDGKSHNISMNVVGLDDDGKTGADLSSKVLDNWKLTGKIFIWLDSDTSSVTTGAPPTIDGSTPTIAVSQTITKNAAGSNDTLYFATSVTRNFKVSGSITTSTGKQAVTWTQVLDHTDDVTLFDQGSSQITKITTQGTDTSTYPGKGFETKYSYPLNANLTNQDFGNGTTRFSATLSRIKSVSRSAGRGGDGFVSPSGLQLFAALPKTSGAVSGITETSYMNEQSGTAVLFVSPNLSTGSGSQSQKLRFGGLTAAGQMGDQPDSELYFRDISVNATGKVIRDAERIAMMDSVDLRPPATSTNLNALDLTVAETGVEEAVDGMVIVALNSRLGPGRS